jgi:hypothetical protein
MRTILYFLKPNGMCFFPYKSTCTFNTKSIDLFDLFATPQKKYQKLLGVLNQVKIHGPPPSFDLV